MTENYRIITGTDTSNLEKKVNKAIAEGYMVAGGVAIEQQAGGTRFVQALIKKGK